MNFAVINDERVEAAARYPRGGAVDPVECQSSQDDVVGRSRLHVDNPNRSDAGAVIDDGDSFADLEPAVVACVQDVDLAIGGRVVIGPEQRAARRRGCACVGIDAGVRNPGMSGSEPARPRRTRRTAQSLSRRRRMNLLIFVMACLDARVTSRPKNRKSRAARDRRDNTRAFDGPFRFPIHPCRPRASRGMAHGRRSGGRVKWEAEAPAERARAGSRSKTEEAFENCPARACRSGPRSANGAPLTARTSRHSRPKRSPSPEGACGCGVS